MRCPTLERSGAVRMFGQRMNIMHRNDNATVFPSTLSALKCSEGTVPFKVSRRPLGTR
jgi:hypothetical protein